MTTPLLRFVAHYDHCDIFIENLQYLSVSQIKLLESFASARRARLDFESASIKLHKRIDYDHFNKLLHYAGITADTIESVIKDKHTHQDEPELSISEDPVIGFGKYKGRRYSQLPDNYLVWLKQNYQGPERNVIEQACKKRSI